MSLSAPASDQWQDAWSTALAALEMDVAEAESMLALDRVFEEVARDPWTPPVNLGPLPAHLVERARTLLARQLSVSQQLASAARNSRKHDRALSHLQAGTPAPPVYLDTPA
ncbi:hypothetical protein LGT39_03780 [Demequina sp. TTPB684]|uniref:hypothetical protein n=1 Tax=unclassified Demequina TaxID=2620311 RepID=UPI001CF5D64B|nr:MULTISPECIES: hypothetical protein [unclassified Demequina]MCB2411968.1 hypothetical protein [Demequina sp. TTPB684]UPU87900.1 hypothetical protein LGT36_011665 [Demequina sp. TMPB413]